MMNTENFNNDYRDWILSYGVDNKNYVFDISKHSDFINNLDENQLANGDEVFNGFIEYKFKRKHISERLEVKLRLTTMEYGQISISDGDFLYADLVHMELNSNFQNYNYSNGTITITGESQKLGKYSVTIMEE